MSTLIGNVTNINSKHHLKRILWLNQQRETKAGGGVTGPAKRKRDGMEIGGKRKALALGLGPRRGLEVCAESLIIGELLPNGASYIGRCLFSCPIYIYSSQTARKSREPGLVDISCHRGLGGI